MSPTPCDDRDTRGALRATPRTVREVSATESEGIEGLQDESAMGMGVPARLPAEAVTRNWPRSYRTCDASRPEIVGSAGVRAFASVCCCLRTTDRTG